MRLDRRSKLATFVEALFRSWSATMFFTVTHLRYSIRFSWSIAHIPQETSLWSIIVIQFEKKTQYQQPFDRLRSIWVNYSLVFNDANYLYDRLIKGSYARIPAFSPLGENNIREFFFIYSIRIFCNAPLAAGFTFDKFWLYHSFFVLLFRVVNFPLPCLVAECEGFFPTANAEL